MFKEIGKMLGDLQIENDKIKTDKTEALEQLEFVRTLNTVQEAEIRKLSKTLVEIKFLARELLKRTGQVVPYEIKQILQKISECEVEND